MAMMVLKSEITKGSEEWNLGVWVLRSLCLCIAMKIWWLDCESWSKQTLTGQSIEKLQMTWRTSRFACPQTVDQNWAPIECVFWICSTNMNDKQTHVHSNGPDCRHRSMSKQTCPLMIGLLPGSEWGLIELRFNVYRMELLAKAMLCA